MKKSLLLLPLLASFSTIARADLSFTQNTTSSFGAMMGAMNSGISTKIYSKGDASRTESQMFGRKMITVTRGAKSVIQIDPATKTYTVSNIGANALAKARMPNGAPVPPMSMTVATKNLGVQNVRGIKAPHYLVSIAMQVPQRGSQQMNMNMGMEIWGSNVASPSSAKTRGDAMQSLPANIRGMFGNSFKVKGDLKGMVAAFGTVPLRMKMMMNGQTVSTTETSGISTKPLPASLFVVPMGYRAVSNAQFSQMMQASMRKNMGAMMKRAPQR